MKGGSCPYSALMNNLPFSKGKENNEIQLIKEENKQPKEIEISECPFKNKSIKQEENEEKKEEKFKKLNENITKINNEDSDDENEMPQGGCPVMNTSN